MLELEITESLTMDDVAFTREVLGHLRELGVHSSCDQVQGFLFSRPVPAEEAIELLARGAFAL